MSKLRAFIKSQLGLFGVIIFLLLFRFMMTNISRTIPDTVYGRRQQVSVVRNAIKSVIQPNDNIFVASQEPGIHTELEHTRATVISFRSQENDYFEDLLLTWLNERCQQPQVMSSEGRSYFIWTDDEPGTIKTLGKAVRALNFFASFEAVIPYEGVKTIAADKILLLQPREAIINRFCEVRNLIGDQLAMVIVNVDEFPPLLGSFELGNVIWLASSEVRELYRTSYQVKNYPVSLQYMMWKTNWADKWSFAQQETAAYSQAAKRIEIENGIVLVDSSTRLGKVPKQFLAKCPSSQVDSELFEQLCLKVWENYDTNP